MTTTPLTTPDTGHRPAPPRRPRPRPQLLPSVEPLAAAAAQPGNEHVAGRLRRRRRRRLDRRALRPRRPCWSAPSWSQALAASPTPRPASSPLPCSPPSTRPRRRSACAAEAARTVEIGRVRRRARRTASPSSRSWAPASPPRVARRPTPPCGPRAAVEDRHRTAEPVADAAITHRPRPRRLRRRPRRSPGSPPTARRGIEMLHGVDMELTVELGRTRMAVRDLLALAPGDVLELDRAAGSPADLLVNGRLIARGEVVVVDEDFGLRVTQIIDAERRLSMVELDRPAGRLPGGRRRTPPAARPHRRAALPAARRRARAHAAPPGAEPQRPPSPSSRSAAACWSLGTTEQQVSVLAELDPDELGSTAPHSPRTAWHAEADW